MHSILLVDDEPEILDAWRHILQAEGYEVTCASDGVEALSQLASALPDMIITDWMMPLMNGAELCRRLKTIPELAKVPIFVHTSGLLPENETKNWDICLRKPVPMQLFLTTVKDLCKKIR
jgi:CheY-like chemotaxis protein